MKKRTIPAVCFAAVIAGMLSVAGCKQEQATKAGPPPDVLVISATARDVPVTREWVGTLDGSENAQVRARVTGYLLKRSYQEGSLVKKGELLFEIDARPFEAALAEAKSQLEQGKAVQLASKAEAERSKELFDKKVISEKEYVNKTQLNESNVAKVGALEAAVEQAKLNVGFCRIESPVDGIVGIAQAQIGDLVGTGASVVLTSVSTLDPIKIIFPISEVEYLEVAPKLQEGLAKPVNDRRENIEVLLADGKPFPQKGRLLAVDRQVQASTGTILVTALVKNPGSVLRPGQFARARVVAQTLEGAVVVPQRAVMEVQGSFQLGVIRPDGKAEIRPVKTGPRSEMDWVISSGLKVGEKVVVEGLQKIKTGELTTAKPWVPPGQRKAGDEDATPHPETK